MTSRNHYSLVGKKIFEIAAQLKGDKSILVQWGQGFLRSIVVVKK